MGHHAVHASLLRVVLSEDILQCRDVLSPADETRVMV